MSVTRCNLPFAPSLWALSKIGLAHARVLFLSLAQPLALALVGEPGENLE